MSGRRGAGAGAGGLNLLLNFEKKRGGGLGSISIFTGGVFTKKVFTQIFTQKRN